VVPEIELFDAPPLPARQRSAGLKLAPSTASILDIANPGSVLAITGTEPVSIRPVYPLTYFSFTSPVIPARLCGFYLAPLSGAVVKLK
jgi:hypothetical protein